MGIIMINCPATGRRVSTGIETVDIEELPAVTAKMVCPACGGVHPAANNTDWQRSRRERSRGIARRDLELTPSKRARRYRALRLPSPAGGHDLGCGTIRM